MTGRLPDEDEVRRLVLGALRGISPAKGISATYDKVAEADDYFEAFLLLTLLDVARLDAWDVTIRDHAGAEQDELLLRASPGSFVSPTKQYTHALLRRSGAFDLEAHVGVKVRGASGVLHEADLLLLPRAVAEWCRETKTPPTVWQSIALLEAKFISAKTVPLGYGRGVIGLTRELHHVPYAGLVTTRPNRNVDRLLQHWSMAHLGEILSAPGRVDDRALRRYLADALAWCSASGRRWRSTDWLFEP